jgi:hypothetical protein
MNTNSSEQGVLPDSPARIGTVTRKMVRERAFEVAVINGRFAQDASKSDWEQAIRELIGEPDSDLRKVVSKYAHESVS